MGKRVELRKKRNQQNRNTILAVVGGIGLILLIIVGLVYLPSLSGTAAAQEYSVEPVAVSFAAPELSLVSMQGQTESLADFRDKVLLVNNWATWCPPCKAEMPTLVAYYNDHADENFMIVAIEAGEPKDEVQIFVDQYQMPFHVWLDPNGKALDAFKTEGLPNSFVIDKSGIVRLTWIGQINREMLEKYVTPLLNEN